MMIELHRLCLAVWLTLACMAASLLGQYSNSIRPGDLEPDGKVLPPELTEVGVDGEIGTKLPLHLAFADSEGTRRTLSSAFEDGRPLILNLAYYRCASLCNYQFKGMVSVFNELSWTLGDEFRVVTVSIDPKEDHIVAARMQRHCLDAYNKEIANHEAWSFLTGDSGSIKQLADAVGFGFRYLPNDDEYAHASALIICTPDGRVSQYLHGIQYDSETVELCLTEAAAGSVGSGMDRLVKQVVLYCFRFDASRGKYTPAVMNIMRVAGVLTGLFLLVLGVAFWLREKARKQVRIAEKRDDPDKTNDNQQIANGIGDLTQS